MADDFDPDKYLKDKAEGFDPDAYIKQKGLRPGDQGFDWAGSAEAAKRDVPTEEAWTSKWNSLGLTPPPYPGPKKMGATEAFGRQALTSYMQGWEDEAVGKIGGALIRLKGTDKEKSLFLKTPTGNVVPVSDKEAVYKALRDWDRGDQQQAREVLGAWGIIPSIAGDVASQFAMKGLTGARAITDAGQALIGGVRGLGNSEFDLTESGTLADKLNAGVETAANAAMSGAASYYGRQAGDALGRVLRGKAEENAARSVVNAKKDVDRLTEMSMRDRAAAAAAKAAGEPVPKTELQQLGGRMLDEQVIPPLPPWYRPDRWLRPSTTPAQSAEQLADTAALRGMVATDDLNRSLENAQRVAEAGHAQQLANPSVPGWQIPAPGLNPTAVGNRIAQDVVAPGRASPASLLGGGVGKAEQIAEAYRESPRVMTFPEAHSERVRLDQNIPWDQNNPAVSNEVKRNVRRAFERELEATMEAQAGPDAVGPYRTAKDAYRFAAEVAQAADTPTTRALANRSRSLSDHLVGLTAAMKSERGPLGDGVVGWMAATGNKLLRERGSAGLARVQDSMSRAAPSALREYLPAAERAVASPSSGGGIHRIMNALTNNPSALGKWQAPLSAAAARGDRAVAVTDYMLQQSDPEYREHMKELEADGA